MKISKKDLTFIFGIEIILLILLTIPIYNLLKMATVYITSHYQNTIPVIGSVIMYLMPIVFYIFHIKRSKHKEFSKIGAIIYVSITSLLILTGLIMVLMSFNYFWNNNNNGNYVNFGFLPLPIDMIIYSVIMLLLNVSLIYKIFKNSEKLNYYYELFNAYDVISYKTFNIIFSIILLLISGCYFGMFFASFNSLKNVLINANYIFLIFAVLVPFYNVIYFTYNYFKNKTYKSNLIYTIITISLNFLFLFIFLILELTSPNFVVQVGKPLFLIDFALSIPVGSYILVFDLLFTLIISVISLVKLIRSKKSLNKVEETTNN